MKYFDLLLDEAIGTISENIDKKWPYIYKVLKDIVINSGSRVERWEILSGYSHIVQQEIRDSERKAATARTYQNNGPVGVASLAKKDGVPREFRPPTRLEYVDEYFRKWLVEADPVARASKGRKTPYVNHIVRWLLNTRAVFPDDVNTIHELLKEYNKLKHNMGVKVPNLDEVEDPNKLRAVIMSYRENDSYGKLHNKKLPDVVEGIETYRLDTFEDARDVLCNSGWCVRDEEVFKDYSPPLYLFVRKAGDTYKRVALFSLESGELKDVHNQDLSSEEMAKLAPIIDLILSEPTRKERMAQNNWINTEPQSRPHLNLDLTMTLVPILHLLPSAVDRLNPDSLAEAAMLLWNNKKSNYDYYYHPTTPLVNRWPKWMEDKLKEDPNAFLSYIGAVSQGQRIPELEEEALDTAYTMLQESTEGILFLLEYYGSREDQFNGGWPELEELLSVVKKNDLGQELLAVLRHASKDGVKAFLTLAGDQEWFSKDSNPDPRKRRWRDLEQEA